jgi:hypothetical protein
MDKPVTLPPGRAKLATRRLPTGSPAFANTIGMSEVAFFAASAGGVECVTMTSTLSRTNSPAISAKRSGRPSPQRYSIMMLRPSIQPSSPRRCANAALHGIVVEAVAAPRNPTVGSFPGRCWALAASGHAAAAPPSSVMNLRRLIIRSPRRRGRAASAAPRGQALWPFSG